MEPPLPPTFAPKGIIVQVFLDGEIPDPLKVHQILLDDHFRITGTQTGMIFEYYDGTDWQLVEMIP